LKKVAVVVIAAISSFAANALGNGRFPRALKLVEDPTHPDHLVLAGTYGLLTTDDRGKNWHFICEASFSLQDLALLTDPQIDFSGDAMLAGVTVSLNVSRDRGCDWQPSLADPYEFVRDFSVGKNDPKSVIALVESTDGTRQMLEESNDGAVTWHVAGAPIPTRTLVTVDVAASDSTRIYVSALSEKEEGELFVSSDRGATWTRKPIPGTGFDAVPYIARVHPSDPDKIFVRTDAYTNREVIDTANDALLYSADGGTTWTELIRRQAKLFGFALSPDASTILVGYGDPVDPSRLIQKEDTGIYRSATDEFDFRRLDRSAVACLSWTMSGVYVCRGGSDRAFDLGFASASDFAGDASTMLPLLRERDVKGPLGCCPGTTSMRCAGDWESSCKVLGACGDGGITAPVIPAGCPSVPNPDGGAGAASTRHVRCGCRAPGSRTNHPPFWSLVAPLALARRLGGRKRNENRMAIDTCEPVGHPRYPPLV